MTKKEEFRDLVRETGATHYERPFDDLNDSEKSSAMARAYVETVVRALRPGLLPEDPDDLERCYVDGKGDLTADFISVESGHVLILQAKYHRPGKAERTDPLSRFRSVLSRIDDLSGKPHPDNRKLKEAASSIDLATAQFDLRFLILGKRPAEFDGSTWTHVEPISAYPDLQSRTTLRFYDESDLNIELRSARSAAESVQAEIPVRFTSTEEGPPFIRYQAGKNRVAYVGLISASQLAEIYRPQQERLFSQNIREFIGDRGTNRVMKETALTNPHEFFFFNNGISAVATRIEPGTQSNVLNCTGLSIVNGAQTVRSLANAHLDDPEAAREVQVLLKITKVSLASGSDETFLDNIARFSNTQNVVKIADFRSTDPVQRSLRRRFSDLPKRDSRAFVYKNKRSESKGAKFIEIRMEEFAKTIFAYQFGPADMFGGTAYLFDLGPKGGYARVFGDGKDPWVEVDESEFERLAGTWFVCEQTRRLVDGPAGIRSAILQAKSASSATNEARGSANAASNVSPETIVHGALERRWMVFFAVGELLRARCRADSVEESVILRRFARPRWTTEEDGKEMKLVRTYAHRAARLLVKLYETAIRTSPDFKHRNWFRDDQNLQRIRTEAEDVAIDMPPIV